MKLVLNQKPLNQKPGNSCVLEKKHEHELRKQNRQKGGSENSQPSEHRSDLESISIDTAASPRDCIEVSFEPYSKPGKKA
jgi:chloramphenicol 3-O-phosphotransferase